MATDLVTRLRQFVGLHGGPLYGQPVWDVRRSAAGMKTADVQAAFDVVVALREEVEAARVKAQAAYDGIKGKELAQRADEGDSSPHNDENAFKAAGDAMRPALKRATTELGCSGSEVDLALERRLFALREELAKRHTAEGAPGPVKTGLARVRALALRRLEADTALRDAIARNRAIPTSVQAPEDWQQLQTLHERRLEIEADYTRACNALRDAGGPEAA